MASSLDRRIEHLISQKSKIFASFSSRRSLWVFLSHQVGKKWEDFFVKVWYNAIIRNAQGEKAIMLTETNFKEYDCVELLTDREQYGKAGVYKSMQGWICHEVCVEGYALVEFPLYGEAGIVATIDVATKDLQKIPDWNAWVNERIKAEHEKLR